MATETIDVLGIGNAIVDVLAHADDAFLQAHDLAKGSMTLIDEARAESIYADMAAAVECSGGSAANSMVGIASLGGSAAYIGKVHDDQLGGIFAHDIRASGVRYETAAADSGPPSGRCLVLVTPDAQRTMGTFLGASSTLDEEDIDADLVAASKVVYLEGYLWDPPEAKRAFLRAARLARQSRRKVALSLSDPFCVDRHRESFVELVRDHVDLLFANEQEILSLYRADSFEEAVRQLGTHCDAAALTRGAAGSVILSGSERVEVAAAPIDKLVDTTGAGDLYAAGFLHGWTRGQSPAECGRLGSLAAAEIISHVGARPEISLREWVDGRASEAAS